MSEWSDYIEDAPAILFFVSLTTIFVSGGMILLVFGRTPPDPEPGATVLMLLFGALFVAGLAGLATVARLTRRGGGAH